MAPLSASASDRSPFRQRVRELWSGAVSREDPRLTRQLTFATCALLVAIGIIDYLLGFEYSCVVFYFLPIALGTIARGWPFGLAIAFASIGSWMAGDLVEGKNHATVIVTTWNIGLAVITYGVLIVLLSSILALQRDLELRVRQRTAALTAEIAERVRLEKIVLETSERERRSIGRDLHDGLGQHLTGTALTGQILVEKLRERGAAEAVDARKVVGLVKAGIEQTRSLAKGLLLAEVEPEGLLAALQEFAASMSTPAGVTCAFHCGDTFTLPEGGSATHLYRIAQEAVRNAVRHGRARRVELTLFVSDDGLLNLTVRDDGSGLPPPEARGDGLGLRIMAHRAAIIGGTFTIENLPEGGTIASCSLPLPAPLSTTALT